MTHGMSRTRVYRIWKLMKNRCCSKNAYAYEHYGGRGITVSPEWLVFSNFYGDMGDPPEGYTLERIDNNLGYSKENCRWASRAEQMLNTRRTHWIELNGERLRLKDWCDKLNIKPSLVCTRLARGWPVEKALSSVNTMKG